MNGRFLMHDGRSIISRMFLVDDARVRAVLSAGSRWISAVTLTRPLVSAAVGFCAGISWAAHGMIPRAALVAMMVCALVAMALCLRRALWFGISFAVAGIVLGACGMDACRSLAPTHIANLISRRSAVMTVRGVIISEPIIKEHKTMFTLGRLQVSGPHPKLRAQGAMLVYSYQSQPVALGQEIEFTGKVGQPFEFRRSERFNYRDYLRQRGIYAQAWIAKHGEMRVLGQDRGEWLTMNAARMRARTLGMLRKYLSPVSAEIMAAILVGSRTDVPEFVNLSLQRSGTVHVLAVSGLHVGFVAAIILGVLYFLPMPYQWRTVGALLLIIWYCMLAGCGVSIVRATIMACAGMLATIFRRDYDPWSSVSLAACVILWLNPWQLYDIGFQLSFAGVISVGIALQVILPLVPAAWQTHGLFKYVVAAGVVSLAAWLGTGGIVAYHFGMVTPIAVIANLFIIPLAFFIILAGILLLIAGGLLPLLAEGLAMVCEALLGLLYVVNRALISVPGAYRENLRVSVPHVILFYIGLAGIVVGLQVMQARNAHRQQASEELWRTKAIGGSLTNE